jgi:hypothetical protein
MIGGQIAFIVCHSYALLLRSFARRTQILLVLEKSETFNF